MILVSWRQKEKEELWGRNGEDKYIHVLIKSFKPTSSASRREIPLRRTPLLLPRPIRPNTLLRRPPIRLKLLQLRRVHMLNHMIRLPLLERKPQPLMAIVLVIRLILVILDLHELVRPRRGIQAQAHEPRDCSRLGQQPECPRLLVLELDHVVVGAYHLVAFVYRRFEELRQREPLACHLVPVVGVHELVVVDAVGRVALYARNCRLAAVESDDLCC
jgi:hypothetical protein